MKVLEIDEKVKAQTAAQLGFMAPAVIEVIEGSRSVTQLGGLINEDVYQLLRQSAIELSMKRRRLGICGEHPKISVTDIHQESSRPGLIDSIVLLRIKNRTRAMTVRLEQRVGRWLATAITIL
ncbi:MAG: hypothetical protein RL142_463 [Actinomycetota bacterium]|jgi:hypothetical protein